MKGLLPIAWLMLGVVQDRPRRPRRRFQRADGAPDRSGACRPTRIRQARPERDRDDGSPGILLVAVLMKTEFRAGDVAVDQASVGIVVSETGLGGGAYGEVAGMPRASRARALQCRDPPGRSGSPVRSDTQPTRPQLVIATDMV